jgi:hypothetical protein
MEDLRGQMERHAAQLVGTVRSLLRVEFAGYWSVPQSRSRAGTLSCLGVALPGQAGVVTDRETAGCYDVHPAQVKLVLDVLDRGQDFFASNVWTSRHAPGASGGLSWARSLGLRGVYARPVMTNGRLVGVIAAGNSDPEWAVSARMRAELRRLGNRAALHLDRLTSGMAFEESAN